MQLYHGVHCCCDFLGLYMIDDATLSWHPLLVLQHIKDEYVVDDSLGCDTSKMEMNPLGCNTSKKMKMNPLECNICENEYEFSRL